MVLKSLSEQNMVLSEQESIQNEQKGDEMSKATGSKEIPGVVPITFRIPETWKDRIDQISEKASPVEGKKVRSAELIRSWIMNRMEKEDRTLIRNAREEVPMVRKVHQKAKEEARTSPEEIRKREIKKELKKLNDELEGLGSIADERTRQLLLGE